MDNIKEIYVEFENNERIKIGSKNIKNFSYKNEEILLEVVENGDSEYTSMHTDNEISPIQRLAILKDISVIEVRYENESIKNVITPEWYYKSEWDMPQENKYQINKVIDYKNRVVLISKKEYIKHRMLELNNIMTEAREEYNILLKELANLNNK